MSRFNRALAKLIKLPEYGSMAVDVGVRLVNSQAQGQFQAGLPTGIMYNGLYCLSSRRTFLTDSS